jgi:hypothetical protein
LPFAYTEEKGTKGDGEIERRFALDKGICIQWCMYDIIECKWKNRGYRKVKELKWEAIFDENRNEVKIALLVIWIKSQNIM